MNTNRLTGCKYVDEYINYCRSEKYLICEDHKKMISLVLDIFENENLQWDNKEIEKYLSYQKYFSYELFEWEKFVFVLHNCIRDENGLLRFNQMFIYIGRGNGKNGYLSFEDFCLLTPTNKVEKYDMDICSNCEEQSKTTFMDIKEIFDDNKEMFKKFFKWNLTEIKCLHNGNKLKYRTASAKTKDGLRTSKVSFDELHQYQDYKMIEVMITGLGKKADSRITFITTNGEVRGGVLDDYLNKCNKILNREIDDNGFLPFLCHIESEEEVDDEKMWYKANPSLQYLPNLLKEMKSEYVDYKLDPNKNTSFMNKRMNFYKQSTEELVAKWEDIAKTNQQTELRHKQNVILGIDFSKTTDFISVCVVGLNNGFTDVIHHSFWCKQSNDKQYVKVPLDEFEKKGFVTQIDDVEINIDVVMEYINKMKQEYNIVMCCIDSYRYSFVSSKLAKLGFCKGNENLKLTRPSDIMNTVTSISSLFVNNKLRVGDDALFRWFTNNTKLVPKPNNNFYYEKIEKRSRKTDGFMAFVNAYTSIDLLEMKQINFIKPIIL